MKLFHIHSTTVSLQPNQQVHIELEYIPLKLAPRQCSVILHNKQHGDIVSLVSTTVNLPLPSLPLPPNLLSTTVIDQYTKTIHMKTVLGKSIDEVINVGVNNEAFESAVQRLGEWEMCPNLRKQYLATGSTGYMSLLTAIKALNLESTQKQNFLSEKDSCLHFNISCDSEFLKLPKTVSVQANSNSKYTQVPVSISCDREGNYPCFIVLSSLHDIRVYKVEVMVINKGRQAELEMRTPALDKLTQRIPLVSINNM